VNYLIQNEWYYSDLSIGIDGDQNVQSTDWLHVGVINDIGLFGNSLDPYGYAYCEWSTPEGGIPVILPDFQVSPGDTVNAALFTSGAGATEATVLFSNLTQTKRFPLFTIEAPTGVALSGDSAEWIVARPTSALLAVYGEVFFTGEAYSASADGGNLGAVDAGTGNNVDMTNNAGDVLSQSILYPPDVVKCIYMQSN
jgi:hypothetical protein